MGNRTRLGASVVGLAAAVAIFIPVAWAQLNILGSFPISTTTPPVARTIIYWDNYPYTVKVLFYGGPGLNYLCDMYTNGSIVTSVLLPNAVSLKDADWAPVSGSGWAAIDEGTHELKMYSAAGSFEGVFMSLPSDVIAYGQGGWTYYYLYFGTAAGQIYRYTTAGSFLNSFSTGVALADLGGCGGYEHMWGDYVYVGPANNGEPVRVFCTNGSLAGTFNLPGEVNMGTSITRPTAAFYNCLRRSGSTVWAYHIIITNLMAVQPTSLGRVKVLFK